MKQTFESPDLTSMLEPRGLHRTGSKRQVSVTMFLWEMGKRLVCDVTVVDTRASSRMNQFLRNILN